MTSWRASTCEVSSVGSDDRHKHRIIHDNTGVYGHCRYLYPGIEVSQQVSWRDPHSRKVVAPTAATTMLTISPAMPGGRKYIRNILALKRRFRGPAIKRLAFRGVIETSPRFKPPEISKGAITNASVAFLSSRVTR